MSAKEVCFDRTAVEGMAALGEHRIRNIPVVGKAEAIRILAGGIVVAGPGSHPAAGHLGSPDLGRRPWRALADLRRGEMDVG